MDITQITQYIQPDLLILIPALWGIGMAVKSSRTENRFIPAILLVCSCSMCGAYLISENTPIAQHQILSLVFMALTQGSVIWLCAWYGYEKFLKEKRDDA